VENSIQNSIMTVLGGEPLSANDIAEQIDFPRQKIYYHIKKLEKEIFKLKKDNKILEEGNEALGIEFRRDPV